MEISTIECTIGALCLSTFVLGYIAVMFEEKLHLRKSKPVMLAGSFIWCLIGFLAYQQGNTPAANEALDHIIAEYAELFLFIMVAMAYINSLEERLVFDSIRVWLIKKQFKFKHLFWITGILGFFISPIADNMTTALVMCAVIMAVSKDHPSFIAPACINVVVAVNAGGAFSPFGDITTLMVWQEGVVSFNQFFHLFLPSVINFLVPALFLQYAVPNAVPFQSDENVQIKFGGKSIVILFLLTIATSVLLHQWFDFPPTMGMMMGLAYLQFQGYYINRRQAKKNALGLQDEYSFFDVFKKIQRLEWDTLLFFYGVMMCVGGLHYLGYLGSLSKFLYQDFNVGFTGSFAVAPANIFVGLISAVIDNIPVMYAVLSMKPEMSLGQWLLVTMTAGVGGSLLSIGSAAGVALMGQSKGHYTFSKHLKWSWAVLLGFIASVAAHLWLNQGLF